jgi:hypothetical protein
MMMWRISMLGRMTWWRLMICWRVDEAAQPEANDTSPPPDQ